jgi:hypothetical protein
MACPFAAAREEAEGSCAGSCSDSSLLPILSCQAEPLVATVTQVLAALDYLGKPLGTATTAAVKAAVSTPDADGTAAAIQKALDPHCLAAINVNPESRVKLKPGPVKPLLVESGWTVFLVKIENEAGVTAHLRAMSPNAGSTADSPKGELRNRWLDLSLFDTAPMEKTLSGHMVEYRLVQLYSRDAGMREAKLLFDVGQGTQDLGFRNEIDILFKCLPAQVVLLRVHDEDGAPCAAAGFEIRDEFGRVYPVQSKRSAPDSALHPEIYRGDGESLRLPPGSYTIKAMPGSAAGMGGGPELIRAVDITPELTELSFKLPNMPTLTSPPEPELAPSSSGTAGAMWCCVVAGMVGCAALAGVKGAGMPLLRRSD